MTLLEYLNLIPAANRNKPKFVATISIGAEFYAYIQFLLQQMSTTLFDLDLAVGDQLDIIGKWVGISREVRIPVSGVYFSWDGSDPSVGWDFGSWQPSGDPTEVVILPDDAYRTVIKFKIAANHWDGTTDGAYAIWAILFPDLVFLIQDNQDMTYDLLIIGDISSLMLALIRSGAIALKPEGIRIANYYRPSDDGPVFAWDIENEFFGGWDEGSWATALPPL